MTDEIFLDGKVYVSAHDASRTVGVTGDYIARLAKAGRFPARRLGRNWFVDREAVRALFNPSRSGESNHLAIRGVN
jgi:excisionase family DNA binding protein